MNADAADLYENHSGHGWTQLAHNFIFIFYSSSSSSSAFSIHISIISCLLCFKCNHDGFTFFSNTDDIILLCCMAVAFILHIFLMLFSIFIIYCSFTCICGMMRWDYEKYLTGSICLYMKLKLSNASESFYLSNFNYSFCVRMGTVPV